MDYIQGFLVPVRTEKKAAYREMAADAAPIFADYGATRVVETWGDAVMDGTRTDMKRAIALEDNETVVFSWIRWPDRATCDAAAEKMMTDERMKMPDDMPFDGKRLIYAGYDVANDSGERGRFGYIDGMVGSVPSDRRQAFVDHAEWMTSKLKAHGALRVVNGWGADVPDGKLTDFKRAVQAEDGETVTFGWIEWPDKTTHDTGWGALMAEGVMQENPPAWDGKRAIFGGFAPIFDTQN